MNQEIGKIIILIGVLLIIVGGLYYYFGNIFSWLGRLPGDIKIEKEGFSFYAPITSMLLISVVVSIILRVLKSLL